MSSSNNLYSQVRRFVYNREPQLFEDICHDAYLSFYNTSGLNLYEQSPALAFSVAKRTMLDYWKSQYWQRDGVRTKRSFETFSDGEEDGSMAHAKNTITPQEVLEEKETRQAIMGFYKNIKGSRSVFLKDPLIAQKIVGMRIQGYTNVEIALELGVSKGLITYYLKNFKVLQNQIMNPIVGSKVRIVERMNIKKFSNLSGYVDTKEGNETVAIYVKQEDWPKYEATMACDGILVKLTKD